MLGENLLKIITLEEKLPTKHSYIELIVLIILLYTFDTQPSVELPSKQPTSYVSYSQLLPITDTRYLSVTDLRTLFLSLSSPSFLLTTLLTDFSRLISTYIIVWL